MKTYFISLLNLRQMAYFVLVLFFLLMSISKADEFKVKGANNVYQVEPFNPDSYEMKNIDNSLKWLIPLSHENLDKNVIKESFNEYYKKHTPGKGSGWKPYKRTEQFWERRFSEESVMPNLNKLHESMLLRQDEDNKKSKMQNGDNQWEFMGPSSAPRAGVWGEPTGLGRMNCMTFNPRNPSDIWAGAAFGGLWHSTNGGGDWETFPFTQFMSIGISDVAVANTSNTLTNIIYAATGDADGAFGGIGCYSIGIIKSSDNGKNWTTTNFSNQIADRLLINRLLVDPRDTNRVFAATTRGLFLTEDGGVTWDTLTNAYTRDLEFFPSDNDQLWAAFLYGSQTETMYGLFRVELTQKEGKDSVNFYPGVAFNYGDVIRMSVTVNEENPDYVYVLSATAGGGLHSVIYTSDGGQNWYFLAQTLDNSIGNYTWDLLNARSDIPDSISTASQGFYDLCIAANPENPMDVYIGGVNVWRFRANNQPWELVAFWTTRYQNEGIAYVHADHHDLKFTINGDLYSAHDGGISKYYVTSSDWHDLSNGLEVTQFYRINAAKNDNEIIICGSQDNGTSLYKYGQWFYVRGGDGMDCQIDPFINEVMYSSIYYGDFDVSRNGGETFSDLVDTTVTGESAEWVTPFVIDPVIPDDIYVGYENIWKAGRKGLDPFERISNFDDKDPIRHIAISRTNHDVIYLIKPMAIYRTTNAGNSWESIITGNGDLALTSIAIDPKDPLHIWFSRGAFVEGEKVFEFKNGNLYNRSEGIPNVPASSIVYNRNSDNNQMFLGTDIGVFFREDGMPEWEIYGKGLPNVVIQDLDIHYASGKLRAATFGRGLWEVKIVDCVIDAPEIELSGSNRICEGDTIILSVPDIYASYEWSTGATSSSISVWESGIYNVKVKDENGCVGISEDVSVTVIIPPDVTIKNLDGLTSFCDGDSLRLDAGPALHFKDFVWSNGDSGRTIYVKESGTYTVTGITREGCKKTSEIFNVVMLAKPEKPVIMQEGNDLISSAAESYVWYYDNKIISGAVGRRITVNKTGYYKVEVTNKDGCSNISDPLYVEIISVDNYEGEFGVRIYPNPANDELVVDISSNQNVDILLDLTNILGNSLFKHREVSNGRFSKNINIEGLSSGLYFIRIMINNQVYHRKIVKQ
jgi:hypothetical protein